MILTETRSWPTGRVGEGRLMGSGHEVDQQLALTVLLPVLSWPTRAQSTCRRDDSLLLLLLLFLFSHRSHGNQINANLHLPPDRDQFNRHHFLVVITLCFHHIFARNETHPDLPMILRGHPLVRGLVALLLLLSSSCHFPFKSPLLVQASIGDRLNVFRNCFQECLSIDCSNSGARRAFEAKQPFYLKLLGWDCVEECRHQCQTKTIDYLLNDVQIKPIEVPQFYGKWTFVRILGVQEPASALFSICNLLTTYFAWRSYCRVVLGLSSKSKSKSTEYLNIDDPYFMVTTISAILSMNAWLWSTVFHVHDIPLTEKLDYFSAFSVVIFFLYAVLVRVIEEQLDVSFMSRLSFHLTLAVPFLAYYAYHIHFLAYIDFDYGYNMSANLVAGFSGSLLWLFWCYRRVFGFEYRDLRKDHVMRCFCCVFALNVLLLLELGDFPPVGGIIDAHSLWHLSTIVIPFYWFSFLSDEALFMSTVKRKDTSVAG